MRVTTLHSGVYLKTQTLFYYNSFIEVKYQRFILVLHFDTPNIFFVALFNIDFLTVFPTFASFVTLRRMVFLIE